MTIEIADRLIKLRKKHGLSQEELADKLGLSRQAVSKWERAEASPDTDNLICLAKLYNVSLDELLSTDEDVDTIVKEQIKKEEKKPLHNSIHIQDDDGSTVDITNDGVICTDKDGKKVEINKHFKDKPSMIIDIVEGAIFTLTLIVYIILGSLCNMWATAWVFLFAPGILASIARVIRRRNFIKFNMVFLACFVFFFVCAFYPGYSQNLWHPMWLVFLAIPAYYSIVGSINKIIGKKDPEEKEEK